MLENKVCIVTGGGHGIGEATAKELARHGAKVVVNDLGTTEAGEGSDEEPAQETAQDIIDEGGEAMAHFGDVTDVEYTQTLINDTIDEYGRIDSVGNFAGILRDRMSFNMTEEEWDIVIDIHLKGHFSLIRNLAAHWRDRAKNQGGELDSQRAFLAVSSEAAFGNPGQINYSAAKAGILGLARTAARELYRYNVRVNALTPRAWTRLIQTIPEEYRQDPDEMADPSDLAPVTAFLLSDGAEDITGLTVLTAGEKIGLYSDPELRRMTVREGGWTIKRLTERFREDLGEDEDLQRLEPAG